MSRSSVLCVILGLIVVVAVVWWGYGTKVAPPSPLAGPAAVAPVSPLPEPETQAAEVSPPRAGATPAAQSLPAVSAEPDAKEVIRSLRQDLRWEAPIPEPVFAEFKAWTKAFAESGTAEERALLLVEGIELAQQRRNQIADLIDQNPKRALELAVPVSVRKGLPAEIVALLEEPVSGRGDLFVMAVVAAPGKTLNVRPVQRSVTMGDGREFEAFTYGLREQVPTKANLAIQGIAVDGKLALTELPGRILEPVEVAALDAGSTVCPTSGLTTSTTGEEVVVDWDGSEPTFFCGPNHALDQLMEAAAGDTTVGGGGFAPSANTEGVKTMLIIRVDFPDDPGQVVSDATLTTLISNMSTHWEEMSFGKTTWATVGNGSDFTPTLRLQNGHASYKSFGTMLNAARAAATAAGYNYQNYTHEVVVTGDKPDVSFGGVAFVGARGAWLANSQWNLGVCSHEVGHNFGLLHSGFWDTDDGTVIGSGSAVEYGNPFDHMGGASSSTNAHFGARQKNFLDWIADSDVVKITTDGSTTTRIRAFDKSAATGKKALAVDRTGTSDDYWIEYRQTYAASKPWMRDGVVLNWGNVSINNQRPLLLDNDPGTSTKDDCAVLIGRTFSDPAAGIHITPLQRGADADGTSWVDVTVNRGPFTGNQKPSVSVSASNLNPATNSSVTFTATASDPDGDPLGFCWDWGDGTFTANNNPIAVKSWSATGTKTVRCHVTDMKGQTTTGQLLVQVGSSSTFFIQGTVTTTIGAPVSGALVKADDTHTDTTDSEGYYAITGLAAGTYTVTATKTGLTIQPGAFSNPVTVGPSQQNVNFTAPPGSPFFSSMKSGLVDAGANTGAVIVPVKDADTLVTDLTLTATSSDPALIPDTNIVFGTAGTTVRTVTATALANVGGPVNITITAMDPQGGTGTYVWPVTVNAKPVLATSAQNTSENTPVDIDLRNFVTDDLTPSGKIRFEVSRARNGEVSVLPDGYTARFTPTPNYNGAASFRLVARDQSLGPRTLMLYDFEPPDVSSDAKSTDVSNFNRTGTLETGGVGGEYTYSPEIPPLVAPYDTQSLGLSESGSGGARVRRSLAATDLNYNDADWSFSAWVNRTSSTSDDFVLYLGAGTGFGPDPSLQLYFPAGSESLKLGKYGSGGLEKEITGPDVPVGEWHHVTLTYDRTSTNSGNFALYLDGFVAGSVNSVAMNVSQSAFFSVGGHNSTSANPERWLDGSLDDVLLQSGLNNRSEIWFLAHMAARSYNGLNVGGTVNVTVAGTNQAPSITGIPGLILPVGAASPPIPFLVSDAESEDRNLGVTVASSNPSLLPLGGIVASSAPPAWVSGNIGSPITAGSLTQDHGTFVMAGAGTDIGGTADQFRWTRQDLNGDGEIIARVESIDFSNVDAKAGVMMRAADTDTSPYAFALVTPSNGVAFHFRASDGAAAEINGTVNRVAAPCWLRLVRTGNDFSAYFANDVEGAAGPWQQIGTTQTIPFAGSPNTIGLAVVSKTPNTANTVIFEHLGGTVSLGGERSVTLTPASGASGSATVTLTAGDGSATASTTFDVLFDGAPPSTTSWNATATSGPLDWSNGANWTGGTPPPSSRFSTVEFFTGQTLSAGTITSNNDTSDGHALNVLTLGGTGPTSGTTTILIGGNPILLRRETTLFPAINLTATNGTGLTYDVSAPLVLDDDTTAQGNGTATFILSGGVGGTGGLVKTGNSRLILAGDNTYPGGTTIEAGTLQIGNDGATGTPPPGELINNGTLRFDRTGTLTVPNVISGSGGLTIDCPINAGTIVLAGPNSFTGGVNVSSGTLRVTNSDALGTPPPAGFKTITLSAGTAGNVQLRLDGSGGNIDLPAGIRYTTSNSAGSLFNEAGNNILRGNITCASGGGNTKATVLSGTLTLEGNISTTTTGRSFVMGGPGTGFCNGVIQNGSGNRILGVNKTEAGNWTLSGSNTYSGTTTVSAGTLRLGDVGALGHGGIILGNATGGTSVNAGATLDLNGRQGINEVLTIRGAGVGGAGGLVNNSATEASIAGGMISSISTTDGGTHGTVPSVTISGTGTGATATASLGVTAASFTINGGTTVYSSAPTVTISGGGGAGATATAVLSGGVVSGINVTNPGTGYTSAPSIAFSGGTVSSAGTNPTGTGNNTNFTVSGITVTNPGSGYTGEPVVSFGSGAGTTAIANLSTVILGAATTIGGSGDITIGSEVSGGFALTKTGAGTLTLAGDNPFTGTTTVGSGTLKLSGDFANNLGASSSIEVAAAASLDVSELTMGKIALADGQVLGGSGTINGGVRVAGTSRLSPGTSPGTLSINGTLDLSSAGSGSLLFELNSLAGTNDRIAVTGSLVIGDGTLAFEDFGFTDLGGLQTGTYKLITSSGIVGTLPAEGLEGLIGSLEGRLQINGNDLELVVGSNAAPSITAIDDLSIPSGGNTGALGFTIGDVETDVDSLILTVQSSNTSLAPIANIVIGGVGANRTVTVTPVSGKAGSATLTVTVSDGGKTASETFVVTVNANYLSWATDQGIPGAAPTDDDDGDGIDNVVEYALGLNPKTPDGPTASFSGNTITFTKGAAAIANGDVSWTIQTSTSLEPGSWTPQVSQAAGDPSPSISHAFDPDASEKEFARLRVLLQ